MLISAMKPVFVILWSASFRANFPESVVLVDDGGDKVVGLVHSLHREGLSVRVGGAAVGVVSNGVLL